VPHLCRCCRSALRFKLTQQLSFTLTPSGVGIGARFSVTYARQVAPSQLLQLRNWSVLVALA
jgi:hypothetical protein